jgi:hypothetical protein
VTAVAGELAGELAVEIGGAVSRRGVSPPHTMYPRLARPIVPAATAITVRRPGVDA